MWINYKFSKHFAHFSTVVQWMNLEKIPVHVTSRLLTLFLLSICKLEARTWPNAENRFDHD